MYSITIQLRYFGWSSIDRHIGVSSTVPSGITFGIVVKLFDPVGRPHLSTPLDGDEACSYLGNWPQVVPCGVLRTSGRSSAGGWRYRIAILLKHGPQIVDRGIGST